MAGKQHKKERKAAREAERRAAARAERQRNIMTVIVVGIVVGIGGVLVWLSLEDGGADLAEGEEPTDEELEELLEELQDGPEEEADGEEDPEGEEGDELADVEPCDPAPPPAQAGEDKPTFDAPEQVTEEGAAYQAVIETSCGQVVVALDHDRAPEAVNSFVFLAEQGFYDGLEIFRHAPSIFALQTGAGDDTAGWQVGYQLSDELEAAEADGYPAGAVAMANSGPDTSGSQFFFVYADSPLPPDYTKFGDTVEGLDVLRSIGAIETEGEAMAEQVYMETVSITTQ